MGGQQSSEARGVRCSGCDVWCPPANPNFDFIKACEHSGRMTFCFWTPNEHQTSITRAVEFSAGISGVMPSAGVSSSVSITVQAGARLFKYFRNKGVGCYYCSKCFAKQDLRQAKSVFLELAGRGQVVSTDFELVKIGKI